MFSPTRSLGIFGSNLTVAYFFKWVGWWKTTNLGPIFLGSQALWLLNMTAARAHFWPCLDLSWLPKSIFFSPKQKVRPTFIFHPKTPFFFSPEGGFFSPDAFQFHPRNFPWVCACHVRFHPYCDPRSSRVPVPPAAPHGDPRNPSHVPLWVFECLKRMAAWCFLSFFFWGVWIFLGAKTQQYGFFPNNQPKLEQFSGVLQFSRFQPGFLFLFYHLKAGSGCSSRIPPSKAPNSLCTKLLHLIPDSVGGWIGL